MNFSIWFCELFIIYFDADTTLISIEDDFIRVIFNVE